MPNFAALKSHYFQLTQRVGSRKTTDKQNSRASHERKQHAGTVFCTPLPGGTPLRAASQTHLLDWRIGHCTDLRPTPLPLYPCALPPSWARLLRRVRIPGQLQYHGIDVSHHQGTVNWEKVATALRCQRRTRTIRIRQSHARKKPFGSEISSQLPESTTIRSRPRSLPLFLARYFGRPASPPFHQQRPTRKGRPPPGARC